jgi:DNA topoisomerase-1
VSFDFTAGLENELDEVSGGRADWQAVLDAFWRDFKPKTAEVMEQKPSDITAALDEFLAPFLFPERTDGADPRLCPTCGEGRLGLRGGRNGAFIGCSNYPECKFTRRFGQGGDDAVGDAGPQLLGVDDSGLEVTLRTGRFGPYVQQGEGKEAKRASVPKDVPVTDVDLPWAVKLLSLPRPVGDHPETGKPITASIGRYGPYLAHDGKYAKLASTAEVYETGMNAAVAKLADAAAGGGRARGSREPLKVLGLHPRTELELKVMEGRFGPYVTDGTTNATLPKDLAPDALTLEEAAQLIDDRAAKGGGKKPARRKAAGGKGGAKKAGGKAAAKKPAKKA